MMNNISALVLILYLLIPTTCFSATPTIATPTYENVGANMATLVLQSSENGTGYFTLLTGSNVACGGGLQVKAGLDSASVLAPYHGWLELSANMPNRYTIRNLTQNTTYTICFTADSPSGLNLQPTPVSTNISTLATKNITNPVWEMLGGTEAFEGNGSGTALSFAPDGTAYVAFGDPKATVKKYSNGNWNVVGTAGFSFSTVYRPTLTFSPDGIPYVTYQEDTAYSKATIMKFSDGVWSVVGTAGLSARMPSLVFAPDGTPYLAYSDKANGSKASVMKFSDGVWNPVGVLGFSAGAVDSASLGFAPDGTPYVAYGDNANSTKATVMKFSGGTWNSVGAVLSSNAAYSVLLAFSPNGTPHVVYTDVSSNYKMTMKKYSGGNWNLVGTVGGVSATEAYANSLTFAPDGNPYVAFGDFNNGTTKAAVKKFNGSVWSIVGASGLSAAGRAISTSLTIAPDGTPHVAFTDAVSHPTISNAGKIKVMKLKTSPTINLVSNNNPTNPGQSTTFNVSVAPADATGTVTFKDGSTTLGESSISGGTASFTTSYNVGGSHSITAVYTGNDSYAGSTSSPLIQFVNKADTTTTLASNVNYSGYGQTVNFTATVEPSVTTGTVTFIDGSTPLGTVTLTNGTANFSTFMLDIGSHSITAVYSGTDNSSTSSVLNLVVKTAFTLEVQISGNGSGMITVSPPGVSFNTSCSIDISPIGSTTTIYALPDQYSITESMIGACVGKTECNTVMDMDKLEKVSFVRDTAHMVRVQEQLVLGNNVLGYYSTLQDAFDSAATGNTIQAWGVEFVENLEIKTIPEKSLIFQGGYNGAYDSYSDQATILLGSLKVNTGKLIIIDSMLLLR